MAVVVALLAFALWLAVRPAPGDWTARLPIAGGLGIDVSVPKTIRLATEPAVARWLHRRTVATPAGRLRVAWQPAAATLVVRCAPCTVHAPGLGAQPLQLASATLSVRRAGDTVLHGEFASGGVVVPWRGRLTRQGLELSGDLPATPIADIAALFAAQVPELRHARIDGDVTARWRIDLPEGRWTVQPRFEGFAVAGLGTETLSSARLPARCAAPARTRPPSRWLSRAVVAAEDARFYEHPGYDLDATLTALAGNQRRLTPAGGSTLTQQLAKIAVTGDERSAARKLRELLYAVEMERTLGKARILELYLALAPWGDGVCGAEQAARRYFDKPAHALDATEAARLATRLRNPEAPEDPERVRRLLKEMKLAGRKTVTSAPDAASP